MNDIKRQQPIRRICPIHVGATEEIPSWMSYYTRRGYRVKAMAEPSFIWTSGLTLLKDHPPYQAFWDALQTRLESEGISLHTPPQLGSAEHQVIDKLARGEFRIRTLEIRQYLLGIHNIWVLRDGNFSQYLSDEESREVSTRPEGPLTDLSFEVSHELRSLSMWAME